MNTLQNANVLLHTLNKLQLNSLPKILGSPCEANVSVITFSTTQLNWTWAADVKQSFQNVCYMSFNEITINDSQNSNDNPGASCMSSPLTLLLQIVFLLQNMVPSWWLLETGNKCTFTLMINFPSQQVMIWPSPLLCHSDSQQCITTWPTSIRYFALLNEFGVVCVHFNLFFYIQLVVYDNNSNGAACANSSSCFTVLY